MDFTNQDRSSTYPDGTRMEPYIDKCFLEIQNDIDRAFIQRVAKNRKVPDVVLQRFPYPKVNDDSTMNGFKTYFSLLFVLCMILSCKNLIKVSHRRNLALHIFLTLHNIEERRRRARFSAERSDEDDGPVVGPSLDRVVHKVARDDGDFIQRDYSHALLEADQQGAVV